MQVRALVGRRCEIVGPETPIQDVANAMFEEGVGAVAVVDRTGLVGICTDRDLARAVADGCGPDTTVVERMATAPDTIEADAPVREAALWMLETGYRHMPVVDDGELLGIIDSRDILWAVVSRD